MTKTCGAPGASRAIQEPRWSKPALVVPGDTLEVAVQMQPAPMASGSLRAPTGSQMLGPPAQVVPIDDGTYVRIRFSLSLDIPSGLYDLELRTSADHVLREPHCVWIASDIAPRRLMFAHISDLHMMSPDKVNPRDRSREIVALMDHLRDTVCPDFIINTGDLVSRYGVGGAPLPPGKVIQQIRSVRRLLLGCRVPHFISAGNHDIAFPITRDEWKRCMGGYWYRDTDDYAFAYGHARFVALDRTVAYDESHKAIDNRLQDGQLEWVHDQVAAGEGRPVFLFCHYDYSRELNPVLVAHPNVTLLYGHTDVASVPAELSRQDAGLRSPHSYQIFHVSDDAVTRSAGLTWDQLTAREGDSQP